MLKYIFTLIIFYSNVRIFITFTKYITFFPLTFHSLSLLSNNKKIITLSSHFLLTFIPSTIFPFTIFPHTFFSNPDTP